MASTKLLTSLTNDRIQKFLSSSGIKERAELACGKITGFHLKKLKKSASWCYRYTDPNGKQRVMSLGKHIKGNQNDFAAIALEQEKQVIAGKDPQLELQKKKIQAIAERQALENKKTKTVGRFFYGVYSELKQKSRYGQGTLNIIKSNFEHLFDREMESLTADDIRQWEKMRKSKSIKRATLVRDFGAFKAMLNYAAGLSKSDPIDTPVIAFNPLERVTLSKLSSQERDKLGEEQNNSRRQLTTVEIKGIYKGIERYAEQLRAQRRSSIKHGKKHLPSFENLTYPHWIFPFTLVALYTGIRPGDLYGLKWSSSDNYISLEMKKIYIVPEKTRDKGESSPKVVLPIGSDLFEIIKVWNNESGSKSSGYVFPSKAGKRLAKKSHNSHWKKILKLGKLSNELDFYSLRHNFISTLVSQNIPLLHISKLVGHNSTEMIEKNYGHLSPNQATVAVNLIGKTVSTYLSK